MFRSRYDENITLIKYGLIVINFFLMIAAIRALVNNQLIVDSISNIQEQTFLTEQKTDYSKNFLKPYLESEFAPYFFAHENNQIFPGETIIQISTLDDQALPSVENLMGQAPQPATTIEMLSDAPSTTMETKRSLYIQGLFDAITLGRIWLPFR